MWMKVDDGLHNHRKTRAVTKSHATKTRDAAPMGLWVLAGSWAGQNGTEGWVPEDELDRWDDDWRTLMARLVKAGYWWPQERDGEPGFGFVDWHDYNDPADSASKAGTFGNHVRWHVNEGKVEPECQHCPREPDEPEYRPDDRGDIGGRSGGDSHPISGGESGWTSGAIALPEPEPEPEPEPNPGQASSDKSDHSEPPERFEEFWETYGNKVGRKKSEVAYRNALKKPGVTDDLIIAAAAQYVEWCRETDTYLKNPLTWLHGEHWADERVARRQPKTRVQEHLSLVEQLAAEEAEAEQQNLREIGYR